MSEVIVPNAVAEGRDDNEPVPAMQKILDNPFLLLFLGITVPTVFYLIWGIMEVVSVPLAKTPSASQMATAPAAGSLSRAAALTGEQIVQNTCSACHTTGVAGAPKIGDHAEWLKRYKVGGLDNLLKVAIHGLNAMPPRGGGGYKDAEMKKAIIYMLGKSGIQVPKTEGGNYESQGNGSG